MKKLFLAFTLTGILIGSTTSCNSLKKLSKEQKGAIIGVGAGGAAGAAIGSKSKNPAVYAIIGSAVGGVAGAVIGKYMDKQADALKKELDKVATVERIEEGIKVSMDSGILFPVNSSTLSPLTKENLTKLATVLNTYDETNVLVAGHTDNTGSTELNDKLSQKRADAVADFFTDFGIKRNRLVVVGYGENAPVSTNETDLGRKQNRRVELAIVASDNLKKSAKKESSNSK